MKKYSILLVLLSVHGCVWALFDRYRAVSAYAQGDLDTAQKLLEPLFITQQTDPEAAYNLGKIAYKKGEYAAAATYTQQAAEHARDKQLQIQAYFDTGNAQTQQEKWQDALASYQAVLERDADHAQARDMIEQINKLLEEKEQQEKEKNKKDQEQKQEQQQNQQQEPGNQDDQKRDGQQEQSDMNNKQRDQQGNNQKSDDELGNDKSTQEREQQGEQKQEQHKEQQSDRGAGDQPQGGAGKRDSNKEQEQGAQHGTESSRDQQKQEPNQDTQELKKEQEAGANPQDREELLMSLLEERDAQLVKEMLQAQVKQRAPRNHGQKNW